MVLEAKGSQRATRTPKEHLGHTKSTTESREAFGIGTLRLPWPPDPKIQLFGHETTLSQLKKGTKRTILSAPSGF